MLIEIICLGRNAVLLRFKHKSLGDKRLIFCQDLASNVFSVGIIHCFVLRNQLLKGVQIIRRQFACVAHLADRIVKELIRHTPNDIGAHFLCFGCSASCDQCVVDIVVQIVVRLAAVSSLREGFRHRARVDVQSLRLGNQIAVLIRRERIARPDVASAQNVTQSDNHVLGHRTTAGTAELTFLSEQRVFDRLQRGFSAVGKLLIRIGARRSDGRKHAADGVDIAAGAAIGLVCPQAGVGSACVLAAMQRINITDQILCLNSVGIGK